MSKKGDKKDAKDNKPLSEEEKAKVKELEKQQKESALQNLIIKKGDYNIHVLVENVMNLAMVEDNLPTPVVKITCNGESKRTKTIDTKVKDYFFNEHFYFDHFGVNEEIFDSAKILIEVYDRNHSSKVDYIGVTEFDYATIYSAKNHSLSNNWIALSNIYSDKKFMDIRGYLKISISILHDSDDRVELVSQDNDTSMVSIPPHIKPEYMQLRVEFFKGEEFPDMDSAFSQKKINKECQPFVTMYYLGRTISTSSVDMKSNVSVWNETLSMPFTYPCTSEKIVFKVFDKDIGSNDLIGSFEINIIDIINGKKYAKPLYMDVYGGPSTTSGKYTDLMNENSECGSNWKGRVLMSISSEKTIEPIMGVTKFNPSTTLYESVRKRNIWSLEFKMIDALFLPILEGKVSFALQYENFTEYSPSRTVDKGNILKWTYERTITFDHLSNNPDELGDVFIYLVKGEDPALEKNRICFQRIPVKELFNSDDILIFRLLADPAIDQVKECKALMKMKIKLKLAKSDAIISNKKPKTELEKVKTDFDVKPEVIQKEPEKKPDTTKTKEPEKKPDTKTKEPEKKPDAKTKEPVKKKPETDSDSDSDDLDNIIKKKIEDKKKIEKKQSKIAEIPLTFNKEIENKTLVVSNKGHTVVANIYQSMEFIAGDSGGTSDAFIEVTLNGVTLQTTIKFKQVNAVWNETLIFKGVDFDIDDKATWPILFFKALDKDTFGNDELGYSYVWLSSSAYQIDNLNNFLPKWHQFYLVNSERPQGELLISFYIIDYTKQTFDSLNNKLANLDISPEIDLYSFEVNVLGLRQLEPLGLLPVKKPYIHFDMNSITIPNKLDLENDIQLRSMQTEPLHSGPNPNINTTINFKVNLPKESVFMPTLTCMVYDKVLFGLSTDILGVFSIDINKMIKNTRNMMKKDISNASNKVGESALKTILGRTFAKKGEVFNENFLNESVASNSGGLLKLVDFNDENLTTQANPNEDMVKKQEEKENANNKETKTKVIEGEEVNFKTVDNEQVEGLKEKLLGKQFFGVQKEIDEKEKKDEVPKKKDFKSALFPKKNQKEEIANILYPQYITEELPFRKTKLNYIKEDITKKPDANLYYELGYENKNNKALLNLPTTDVENENDKDKKPEEDIKEEKKELLNKSRDSNKEKDKYIKKHYRRFYHTELENIPELGIKSPFVKIPIYRDKYADKVEFNDVFNSLRNKKKILKRYHPKQEANELDIKQDKQTTGDEDLKAKYVKNVNHGFFKGLVTCIENVKYKEFFANIEAIKQKNPDMINKFSSFNKYSELSKAILVKKDLLVRVYILELNALAKKDLLSESDPYLKIKLADTLINEKDKHLDDVADAFIYRYYE